jgi:hypothetical protein
MLGSKMCTFGPKFGVLDCVQVADAPIVYVALATAEFVRPLAMPMALIVVVAAILIGPV